MSTHHTLPWLPYSVNPSGYPGIWEWHCHLCSDAKACPADKVMDDAKAHHDMWHTDGGTGR